MAKMKPTSIAVLALCLLNLQPVHGDAEKRAGERETLAVGAYEGEVSLLAFIAESRELYSRNGLDAKLNTFQTGALALSKLIDGDVEIATAAHFPFIDRSLKDDSLRVLASIATADSVELLARKDRGITQPSDLKGKRIGTTLGTISESFLRSFLLLRYIPPDDVVMVNLSPPELVESLCRGDIDAAVTWEIFAHEIKKRMGEGVLSWPAQDYQDYYFLIVTREDVIKKKPRAIELFLKSLVEAEEFVRTHSEEAKAIVSRRWDREPAYVNRIWEQHEFVVSLDQALLKAMEAGFILAI